MRTKDSGGQDRVVENLTPIQEALVAGDDQAGALVAANHQADDSTLFGWTAAWYSGRKLRRVAKFFVDLA